MGGDMSKQYSEFSDHLKGDVGPRGETGPRGPIGQPGNDGSNAVCDSECENRIIKKLESSAELATNIQSKLATDDFAGKIVSNMSKTVIDNIATNVSKNSNEVATKLTPILVNDETFRNNVVLDVSHNLTFSNAVSASIQKTVYSKSETDFEIDRRTYSKDQIDAQLDRTTLSRHLSEWKIEDGKNKLSENMTANRLSCYFAGEKKQEYDFDDSNYAANLYRVQTGKMPDNGLSYYHSCFETTNIRP